MADAGYLTIGKVVKRLQVRYPDLSVSKVRYLEDEGLLNPSRTPGGYRLYSQHDVRRLETILYLQKSRFLPLSVIKEELEGDNADVLATVRPDTTVSVEEDDQETIEKLHPIENMPTLCDVSVGFVQQLAEAGVIELKRAPPGRDLVDGHDFALIRSCDRLRHFGFGAKNLLGYVQAARRESGMLEQALVPFAHKGGVDATPTEARRLQFHAALSELLTLTDQVRDSLIRRHINQAFREMNERESSPHT
jgi:DNA-binding transcriptional MerR regulator